MDICPVDFLQMYHDILIKRKIVFLTTYAKKIKGFSNGKRGFSNFTSHHIKILTHNEF